MSHGSDPLLTLLAAVRWRLWLREAAIRLHDWLWQYGILLLMFAAIHHWMRPLPGWLSLLAGLLLLAVAVLQWLRGRPTLTESAVQADRIFGGKALLTTALECRQRDAAWSSPAATIVAERADAAARQFRPQCTEAFPLPPASTTMLALIPLFAGLSLLYLPGGDAGESPATVAAAGNVAGPGPTADPALPGNDVIAALRSSPAPASRTTGANDAETNVSNSRPTPLTGESGVATPGVESVDQLPGRGPAGRSVRGGEDDSPGDARRQSGLAPRDEAVDPRFLRRTLLELKRTGTSIAADAGRDNDFRDADSAHAGTALDVLAAAGPASHPAHPGLSAAEAAYASRYLALPPVTNDD